MEGLAAEISQNDEELQQGQSAMQQWRTQWEEELTEKNSIDAELLTLRSEFEKSSATYDREIEGLKGQLAAALQSVTDADKRAEDAVAEAARFSDELSAITSEKEALEAQITAGGGGGGAGWDGDSGGCGCGLGEDTG